MKAQIKRQVQCEGCGVRGECVRISPTKNKDCNPAYILCLKCIHNASRAVEWEGSYVAK